MIQNLEELRGPDLATLLSIREQSMREATGAGSLSRHLDTRPKAATFEPFSNSKKTSARRRRGNF